MNKYITSCIAICLTSHITFAKQPIPTACPNVSVIKSTPITSAIEMFGTYLSYSNGKFDTSNYWIFTMGLIEAESESQAIMKANRIKQRLSGQPLPQQNNSNTEWSCQYSLPGEMAALAVTSDDMPSPVKVARQLLRTN